MGHALGVPAVVATPLGDRVTARLGQAREVPAAHLQVVRVDVAVAELADGRVHGIAAPASTHLEALAHPVIDRDAERVRERPHRTEEGRERRPTFPVRVEVHEVHGQVRARAGGERALAFGFIDGPARALGDEAVSLFRLRLERHAPADFAVDPLPNPPEPRVSLQHDRIGNPLQERVAQRGLAVQRRVVLLH